MAYVLLVAALLVFMAAIHLTGLLDRIRSVVSSTNHALAVLKNHDLDDLEKERETQKAAIAMLGSFVAILFRVFIVVAVPAALLYMSLITNIVDDAALSDAATNIYFIIVTSIAMIAALLFRR